MKIKAFEKTDHIKENGIMVHQEVFSDRTCYIRVRVNAEDQEFKYGTKGITLQQAQAMLKVLDVELVEEKEINTFQEFKVFMQAEGFKYDPDKKTTPLFIATSIVDGRMYIDYYGIEEIEEKYNVKLNILRSGE